MATRQQRVEQPVEEPGQPTPIEPEAQVAHPDQPEPMREEDVQREGDLTTMSSLMNPPEIEVDPVQEPVPQQLQPNDMVVIRMNTTLEDFTYGDPNKHYKLEVGKRYRVPLHIGQYLDGLGYVWH